MANIGRPSDYIKKLEAKKIITRDMKLYTYLEKHNNTDLIETSFSNDCEQRREYKEFSHNEAYFKDIEQIIKIQKKALVKYNDNFFNHFSRVATKNIIQDKDQANYLFFLLYSYCNGIYRTQVQKEDIYINSFSVFEHIKNKIVNYLQNNKKTSLETFNTIQLLSDKNANTLHEKMLNAELYDENINEIFSSYIDYSLVHNESSKLTKDNYYVQIDLSSQDEDILRVINIMRKELQVKKKKKHKAIRDGLTLGEKRANMLFTYDCMTLGLSQTYIREQIEYYIQSETRDFTLSNTKFEDYIKELKTYIQ